MAARGAAVGIFLKKTLLDSIVSFLPFLGKRSVCVAKEKAGEEKNALAGLWFLFSFSSLF